MAELILNLLPVNEEEKAAFEAAAPGYCHVYAGRRTVTAEQLARAEVLFGWPRPTDLEKAVHLKWFQTMWAGADEYAGYVPEGAVLTNSSGSNARSVAEHMLASTMALCRKLPQYRDHQTAHLWKDEGKMKTLLDSRVLVVGAGHIGGIYASLCRAMGAHTIGLKRTPAPVAGFDEVRAMSELDDLLPTADVVALVVPHSPSTVGLMDERRIALMKDDAILISSGRGTVLDQDALARAMKGGKLWGAALDVTEPEPLPADSELWDISNLIITPHVAGGMRLEITRRACINMALDNLKRYVNGEELKNRVK